MKVETPARVATADVGRTPQISHDLRPYFIVNSARECGKGEHIFMNQDTCLCGQMARENKYCASCRVEHVHYK